MIRQFSLGVSLILLGFMACAGGQSGTDSDSGQGWHCDLVGDAVPAPMDQRVDYFEASPSAILDSVEGTHDLSCTLDGGNGVAAFAEPLVLEISRGSSAQIRSGTVRLCDGSCQKPGVQYQTTSEECFLMSIDVQARIYTSSGSVAAQTNELSLSVPGFADLEAVGRGTLGKAETSITASVSISYLQQYTNQIEVTIEAIDGARLLCRGCTGGKVLGSAGAAATSCEETFQATPADAGSP